MLEFALKRPNGALEFRYAYHEAIEEAHHTLMFQEFVSSGDLQNHRLGAAEACAQCFTDIVQGLRHQDLIIARGDFRVTLGQHHLD